MDQFSKNTGASQPSPNEIDRMINEACREMAEVVSPIKVSLSGKYEPASRTIAIEGKALDNEEISKVYSRIFFDMLYYFEFSPKGIMYKFNFTTYSDMSFTQEKHRYHMETALDRIPDTGEVTRQDWNAFITQLVNTVDGRQLKITEPGPFYEEEYEKSFDVRKPREPKPEEKEETVQEISPDIELAYRKPVAENTAALADQLAMLAMQLSEEPEEEPPEEEPDEGI